jgi:hypothetical protein
MIETRGGLGFSPETGQGLVGIALISENALQRHDAVGMRLPGAVDHPHPAAGNLIENLVLADAPISVPGPYTRERFLERFGFQGSSVVIEGAAEKAV